MRDLCPEVAWIVSEFEESIRVEGDKDTLPSIIKTTTFFKPILVMVSRMFTMLFLAILSRKRHFVLFTT